MFTPTEEEIRKAYRIVKEFRANESSGLGVFAIDGKMIDAPVVRRAEYILQLANIAFPGAETENNTINGK